jgi:hypothetical protein
MSAPALIRKQDMQRAAEVAKSTGCRVEIKIGDAVVTVYPDAGPGSAPASPSKVDGIDYSRPSL